MTWYERDRPIPFDNKPIEGRFDLSGDLVARNNGDTWVEGWKYPMIAFPSGVECVLWEGKDSPIVHIFREMDLALESTRDEAFEQASRIAEESDCLAYKIGESQLDLSGYADSEHFIISYDNDQRQIVDIEWVQDK